MGRTSDRGGRVKLRLVVALIVAGGAAACDLQEEIAVLDVPVCRVDQPATQLGVELSETSGIVVSRTRPGVFWTHNDSGSDPILYAVDRNGTILGRAELASGAAAEDADWEDLATGSCSQGECLYVADIGDNSAARDVVMVHRLPEPEPSASGPLAVESFPIRFPEGPRDAEALFVLPGERLFVVTKGGDGPIAVYEYPGPLDSSKVASMRPVRQLTSSEVQLGDRVTGASASADGRWVALRTHVNVMIYRTEDLLGDAEEAIPFVVSDVRPLAEPQGEGVALGPEGTVVVTSEGGAAGIPGSMAIFRCDGLDG